MNFPSTSESLYKKDIDKVNTILSTNSNNNHDFEFILSFMEKEKDFITNQTQPSQINTLPPKTSIILDFILNFCLRNKEEFENYKKHLWKSLFISAFKNETWYENVLLCLLNLYIKSEDFLEDEILKLYFSVFNDYKSKLDYNKLRNFFNPEDNYFFNMLKNSGSCPNTFYKVIFFHESIEKVFFTVENKEKCKQKHKKITLLALENLNNSMIDYYIMLVTLKFKSEPVKLLKKDIEIEKNCLRLFIKNYDNICSYFFNLILMCFNQNESFPSRKNLFFVVIIVIRLCSIGFFNRFLRYINMNIESIKLIQHDFSIFNEKNTLVFSNINSNNGYLKCIESVFMEMLTAQENDEEDVGRFNQRLVCLYNIIDLCEKISNRQDLFPYSSGNSSGNLSGQYFNYYQFYEFVSCLQKKIVSSFQFPQCLLSKQKDGFNIRSQSFIYSNNNSTYSTNYSQTNSNTHTLHSLSNITNNFSIENIKNDKEILIKHSEISETFQFIFKINTNKRLSIIYPNWIVLFYKLENKYILYEIFKNLLLTEKEGQIIFYFLSIKDEVSNYFPNFWNDILNNLLEEEKNIKEFLYLLVNLKYILVFNSSILNQLSKVNYDFNISYDTYRFYIQNILYLASVCFSSQTMMNTYQSEVDIDKKSVNDHELFNNKCHIEVLSIFYIVINNLSSTSFVFNSIYKFYEFIIEDYLKPSKINEISYETTEISSSISDFQRIILYLVFIIYKNNVDQKQILKPYVLIIEHIIKYLLKRIYITKEKKYFLFLNDLKSILSSNSQVNLIENIIFKSCKEIYLTESDNGFMISPVELRKSNFNWMYLNREVYNNLLFAEVVTSLNSEYYPMIIDYCYVFMVENVKKLKISYFSIENMGFLRKILFSILKILVFLKYFPYIDMLDCYSSMSNSQVYDLVSICIVYCKVYVYKETQNENFQLELIQKMEFQLQALVFDCI